ncbi:unnamed protein product [Urochloa decumbens]|uniref:F-box domain-containing protein n=1 Tax=Urochloa decumbens TaxID=240449 RepID=A0ABC9G6G5_9POAL
MARHAVPSPSPWALGLTPEIAAAVLRRLPSHADRVRFGAVCRPWRALLARHPAPPPLPWLALPDGTLFSFPVPAAFRFPAAAGYLGSCDDWLLFINGDGGGGYLLLNPFSGDTMRLPSLSRVRHVVGDGSAATTAAPLMGLTGDPPETSLSKMITCPRGVVAAIVGDGWRGRIAVCRPGTDWWVASVHDPWRKLRDIASYDGKVFAVDGDGDLYAAALGEDAHTGEPTVAWANRVIAVPARGRRAAAVRHLVVSGGRLLMVRRVLLRGGAAIKYKVSMADLASSRWVEVPSVGGDTALFVGPWSSVARRVSRRDMLGNRIHFLENTLSGGRSGAYDMSDGQTYPLLPPPLELKQHGGAPATWLFPREQDGALSLCNLPADVFGLVARRLSASERLSLRLVCRDCDAAVRGQWPPRRPPSAYLALPDGSIFTYPGLRSGRFHDCMNYRGAACGGYLLFYEDGGDGVLGLLRLTSPFTGKTRLLPSLLAMHARDDPIEVDGELPRRGTASTWTDADEVISVRKLVACGGGLVAALVGGEKYSKVAVCSLESFTWSCSAHDRWRRYEDLAFCGGRLYALTSAEDLVAFDVAVDVSAGGEAAITRVEMVILGGYATQHYGRDVHTARYLVTSRAGKLLMVRRAFPPEQEAVTPLTTPPGKRVAVFRADLAASRQWVEMSHLGGEALFVGRLCSGAVRAATSAVRGDKVFFVQDDSADTPVPTERWRNRGRPSSHHAVAYDMRDGTIADVLPGKVWTDLPAPPTWLFPDRGCNNECI